MTNMARLLILLFSQAVRDFQAWNRHDRDVSGILWICGCQMQWYCRLALYLSPSLNSKVMSEQSHDDGTQHLVIFGLGYLGEHVAREALRRGVEVTGLTRNVETARRMETMGVRTVVAELESDAWHEEIPRDVDFVLNCVSSGGGGKAGYRQSYYEGMQSIIRWAKGGFEGRLLYTSSTSVYPFSDGEWVREEADLNGASESGQILREAECVLEGSGIARWLVLRLAGLYGPGRHYLLDRIRAGVDELSGDGESYLNLIHVEDVCRAVWACFEAGEEIFGRVYNLSDNAPYPKREVVAWIAEQCGRAMPRFNPESSIRRRKLPNGRAPNRRIVSDRFFEALSWRPQYADFREGYEGFLTEPQSQEPE